MDFPEVAQFLQKYQEFDQLSDLLLHLFVRLLMEPAQRSIPLLLVELPQGHLLHQVPFEQLLVPWQGQTMRFRLECLGRFEVHFLVSSYTLQHVALGGQVLLQ